MWTLFQTVTDLNADVDVVRRRRFGRIVVVDGRLVGIEYRPYSGAVSRVGVWWRRRWMTRGGADCCELYFDQPSPHPAFLVVRLIVASPATRLASIGCAMRTLDEVARVKGTSAALAHVTLDRITDPVAARFGWGRHCLSWSGRSSDHN